jgi:hypothetical protein
MPKLWVKDAGTWKQVKQLYIKDGGVWKSPTVGLINDAGIGKQFYPDTVPTVVYSTPGTRTYTVPFGVTSLRVSYPTPSGIVNSTLAVTPGEVLNVVTGDYNVASSVGALSIPAYSQVVYNHTAGNVDNNLRQTFSVATTNAATASTTNTQNAASTTNLNVNGIFFSVDFEDNQGDFGESITISTVPIATLVGTYRMIGTITSSRGQSGFSIGPTLPTAANSWRSQFNITEFGFSNFLVLWNIRVEQQGWVQITPLNPNVISYNTPGDYTFTVPAGVTSMTATGCGGGGGGGSGDGGANNDGPGYGGAGSNRITQSFSVTPGQVLNIVVGAAGTVGYGQRGGAGFPTMVAGTAGSFISMGGGGGASWNGWGPVGQISPQYFNIITGQTVPAVEDTVYRGGIGVNGANNGGRPGAGTSTNGGSNGGTGGPYNMQAGSQGTGGQLSITF